MYSYYSQKIIPDFSDAEVENWYNRGYVLTRLGKGVMQEVRSLRVNLQAFQLSSENRRVLKKTEFITCSLSDLPYSRYHWTIGKQARDFYTRKFGAGVMTANKIKELFTNSEKSNMNAVFVYAESCPETVIGYCLAFQTKNIIHYAYPFYNTELYPAKKPFPLGMAMMTKAIVFAKKTGRIYIYLGSAMNAKAAYKLQFKGLEWWNAKNKEWSADIAQLKKILKK